MTHSANSSRGFILAEVIIVLVISSIVTVAMLAGLIALVRGMQPQRVVLQGEEFAVAPTFGAFPSAVRLHQTLSDRVAASRAVYVFGGRHISIPTDAAPTKLQPLKLQALPTISGFSAGLPMDANTFYELYASALGDQENNSAVDDFSVAVIGPNAGGLAVTCFVQVRRTDQSISDGATSTAYVMREVKLWDIDDGLLRYAYVEKPAQSANIFVGAVHTWMRYHVGTAAEEGPACVVFPDPWVYAGARGRSDDIPAFSRFSYLFAVSP